MCGTQERNWGPGSGGREPRGHSPGIWRSPQRPPQTEGVHASPSVPHEPTRGCLFLPKMLTATVSVTPGCPMRLHTKDEKIPLPGPPEGPLPRALCPRVSGSPRPQDNCGARPQAPHRPSPHPAPLGWKKLSKILSPRLVWQWGMWRYLSRRRCWTCPRAGSGLCCESATMGPAWAHGCPPGAQAPGCRLPPLGATLLAGSCLGSLGKALAEALRSGVGSSPSCRSTWSLALFGCARGEAAVTGTQNVTGLPARGVQMLSSLHRHSFVKDTTSFAPRGLILLGTFWGSSVGPKMLDAILLGLLEGTASSGLPNRLLESSPGGFMALEPAWPPSVSGARNMSPANPAVAFLTLCTTVGNHVLF